MSEIVVPSNNVLLLDDNSYAVEPSCCTWTDNYTALQDADRAIDDEFPYVAMRRQSFTASFGMTTPSQEGTFTQVRLGASVRIPASPTPVGAAHVVLLIRDSLTGARSLGRWWSVPADGEWHDISETWLIHPIRGGAWDRATVGSTRWRFGIARLPQFDAVLVSRLYLVVT